LRNAVQSLSVSASPQILLVDLSESGDPISDINGLAEVCEPGTVVIAMGQVNDVRLYRDLMMSGLQDYLLKPVSPDALARCGYACADDPECAESMTRARASTPHLSTAIIGTRGGVGASTIATSVAWLLSERMGHLTGMLDLDVHFGTGALALDLEPGRGLTDAIDNPSRIDGLFIERAMIKANDKLSILSAEAPISSPIHDRRIGILPAAGRIPRRVREHDNRFAAQHADCLPAPPARCECGRGGLRTDAVVRA
jgi:pilus assembly protein CpaE